LLKIGIQEDDGEAGGEVLDDVLLILYELMGRYAFTLRFIINNSDEAQVPELANLKAFLFEPSPHVTHRPRLLLVKVRANIDGCLMSRFFRHHIFIALI
jgi:hypothetical protein